MPDRDVDHLLIGGGIAAGNCARWLRRSGADGTIALVGREPDLPYDRPPLSKGYLQGKESREDAIMQDAAWYEENEIEALTRTTVTRLDLTARSATLSDGRELGFRQALLATGANVNRLDVPGAELDGIHYLRTFANSDAIRTDGGPAGEGTEGRRVVLIGGSYIASEVAATLTALDSHCTMVMMESSPLSRTFGPQAGRYFHELLTEHGIEIHAEDQLERFEGSGGRVTAVVTRSGATLEADAVVIGAGVRPDVSLARNAGLELGDGGGVLLDSKLRSSAEGVYAAGDIAEYVSVVNGGRRLRVEHWDVAFNHGKTVALNMLGKDVDHDAVPYFFSDLADWASLEYLGPAYEWDREIVRGSFDDGAFTVFYLQAGVLQGALAIGRSDDLQAARRLIADQTALGDGVEALGDLSTDLEQLGA
jgi:3-phenylpropionate/trans-cinnamate dioxygenase ferredoxin reductase subunit